MNKLTELSLYNDVFPFQYDEYTFGRTALLKPDLNSYLVYVILKELFNLPNGDSFDEDKTQWQWTFLFQDFYIEIYDWKLLSTSIAIYHKERDIEKSEVLAESINKLIQKEATKKKSIIKTVAKDSKHKLLQNPYSTYYSTADGLITLSEQIDQIIANSASTNENSFESLIPQMGFDLWDKKEALYRSAFLMFFSSFEGFLNILYELYLKEELRSDRLYERISREQIDVKLRIAPVYCDGFKVRVLDHEDVRYKNFLKLVNLRNNYVHANLVKTHERYIIHEDNHTFILENEENWDIPTNINKLTIKHIDLTKSYVNGVIDLVFESMTPKAKREFKSVIYDEEIEVQDYEGLLIPI